MVVFFVLFLLKLNWIFHFEWLFLSDFQLIALVILTLFFSMGKISCWCQRSYETIYMHLQTTQWRLSLWKNTCMFSLKKSKNTSGMGNLTIKQAKLLISSDLTHAEKTGSYKVSFNTVCFDDSLTSKCERVYKKKCIYVVKVSLCCSPQLQNLNGHVHFLYSWATEWTVFLALLLGGS